MSGLPVLLLVLVMGLVSRNSLLIDAAAVMLLVHLSGLVPVQKWLEAKGIEAGILLLTVAVLAPLASGKTDLRGLIEFMKGGQGWSTILAGALAAYLTGRGVDLLESNPHVIMGLAIGSILGTAFLRGVPAGPLVAAGMAAIFLGILSP